MLSDETFRTYSARLGLAPATIERVAQVRAGAPLAGVSSGRGNVSGRFASHKMGQTVGVDARTTEYLGCIAYDATPEVLEFWEQPLEIRVDYLDPGGKRRAVRTRVDFLVLERDGIYLDEWKTEEDLLALMERMGGRYTRTDGEWRSPPAERTATALGMRFRLRTPSTVPAEIVQNATFLRDYAHSAEVVGTEVMEALTQAVDAEPGISIAGLLRTCTGVRPDDLYLLIARGDLFVDLARHRLADAFYTPVFPSQTLAFALERGLEEATGAAPERRSLQPGAEVAMGGREWTVVAVSDLSVTFRAVDGALLPLERALVEERIRNGSLQEAGGGHQAPRAEQILQTASPKALADAEQRMQALRARWAGDPTSASPRTLRYWEQRFRAEATRSGFGFGGLIDEPRGRPPGPALERGLDELIEEAIGTRYEVADAPSVRVLHAAIAEAARAAGYEPPAYSTIRERLKHRDTFKSVLRRAGRKAAYQVKEFVAYLAFDTPRHGERPWERAHIDHTQIDLELVDSETGVALGRPWLTLMIDAYSRRILAVWLTFDAPSYRSLMMVMRACVKRWRRLPDEVLVDGGVEFGSIYFEQLLGQYEIHKLVRRGDPRAGSLIERFFGSANTQLWWHLRGQTRPTKDVRSMSPEVDPSRRAVWTLAAVCPVLEEFVFEVYDTKIHPAHGVSPREAYEARMNLTGERANRLIADDATFFFATLPSTPKGWSKASYQRGVKINGRHYTGPEFRVPGVAGTKIPVRYDPADVRHAYVYVLGRWVEVFCQSLRRFPAVSEREVAAISEELAERTRRTNRAQAPDAERLSRFLDKGKLTERVLLQQRRDAQALTVSGPPTPPSRDRSTTADLPTQIESSDPRHEHVRPEGIDLEVFGAY